MFTGVPVIFTGTPVNIKALASSYTGAPVVWAARATKKKAQCQETPYKHWQSLKRAESQIKKCKFVALLSDSK